MTAIDDLTTVCLARATGVLSKYSTTRPGQAQLTFTFEGADRDTVMPIILHDHELLVVTVEAIERQSVGRERDPDDVWAFDTEPYEDH